MIIFLDTGVLGLVIHPRGGNEAGACNRWLQECLAGGFGACVPELADYELRRELIRANHRESIERLDQFEASVVYVPITTAVMRRAAQHWAAARNAAFPTAANEALDNDVILVSQAMLYAEQAYEEVVVATTNVGHLSRFLDARLWTQI